MFIIVIMMRKIKEKHTSKMTKKNVNVDVDLDQQVFNWIEIK